MRLTSKLNLLLLLLAFAAAAIPARAASVYTQRPDDPSAVYLEAPRFPVHADGHGDDSAALQSAIDAVASAHHEGVVFVPEGRYRLTRTVYIWPSIRIIGYGAHRPVFVLADNTPGYQQGIAYMFFFAGGMPRPPRSPDRPPLEGTVPPNNTIPDANPGTFYSAMSNVDFDIGAGNPAAVAIRFHVAQHCFLTHIDFHIGSGLAALKDVGNEAEDLRFLGGDYGILTEKPSPGWQFTLLDSTFDGQRRAAIQEHEAGLTLIHDTFRNTPQAVSIDPHYYEELWMRDIRLENISGPAITISNESNPRTEINLEHLLCRRVPVFATLRASGRKFAAPAETYQVSTFSHGLMLPAPGNEGSIRSTFDASPIPNLPAPAANVIAAVPDMRDWANLRSLGAKGDGVTDDTVAIQRAIATHRVLYVPTGRYVVSDTLRLRPDTVLLGFDPSATQFDLLDNTPGFQGPGAPRPLLEAPRGGHNIVEGVGLSTGGINDRAVGALWMAGPDSLMDDVRFLGGHGTNAPDGTRMNPYNNTHTADPDIHRRWDAQYPSLWVTNGGGGTFADIWTPSTFAQAGLYISDTTTPGHVYELSSEHHVRNEVKLDRVANWEIDALQTEEERGESGFALPLAIQHSTNITFANYHSYRVISSYQPFCCAVRVSDSQNIHFRNMHVDSNSKAPFDNSIVDTTTRAQVRPWEFASLDIAANAAPPAPLPLPSVVAPGAKLTRLANGFFNISGAAVDAAGRLYFVDQHFQRIYRWNAQTREAEIVRDNPLDPANLAFDKSGDLLVTSYLGEGAVYAFRPGAPEDQITLLKPQAAAPRPGATPVLPVEEWDVPPAVFAAPRAWQYVSPDGSIFLPADRSFLAGTLSWGTKMADLLRSFRLAPAPARRPFYVSDEAEEKTYKANVAPDGTLTDVRLFTERGGQGVAQDAQGNVFLAAGQIFVFDNSGRQTGTIQVPERPTGVLFGGPGRQTLFVLTHSSLYSIPMRSSGD